MHMNVFISTYYLQPNVGSRNIINVILADTLCEPPTNERTVMLV